MGWYIFADDLKEVPCSICGQGVKHGDPVYFETFPSRPMHTRCVWERDDPKGSNPSETMGPYRIQH